MVKRFLIVMGVCVAMLISASMFYANPVFAEPEAYHVGCAFAVTGKASWLGEPERNTVLMIAKQINDAGGINGHPLVLHIEDTQGDNTRAVNAMKKLIKKDKVCAIIGPSRSGTSMAAVPVVTQSEIPMISCASAAVITTPVEQRKWVFKVGPDDSDAARNIFAHMNAHNISQVGILTGTTGFGAAGREQLKELAKDYGIEIIADETYNPTDTDMTAQLISIRKTGAQAVINWSIVPAQSIVSKNMQQLKMTIPLYQSHGFANIKYAEAAGDSAEGCIFPAGRIMAVDTLADDHPQKKVLKEYKQAYEATYNDHVSTFGGHAYDALWIVVNALKKVGADPAKIRDELEKTTFVGVGGVFEYSETDHCGLDKDDFAMLTVKDGNFVVLND